MECYCHVIGILLDSKKMTNDYLITEEQEKAARSMYPMVAVTAGPGSGKTRMLINKVVYLLNTGVEEGRIAIVTFTIAAAEELKRRLKERGFGADDKFGFIGTYHALAMRLAREGPEQIRRTSDFIVPPDDHVQDLWGRCLKSAGAKNTGFERAFFGDAKLSVAQRAAVAGMRNQLELFDLVPIQLLLGLVRGAITAGYIKKKYPYVIIDEAQDMNTEDLDVCRRLWNQQLFMVGDPKQCIYSFRGANGSHWVNIATTELILTRSFRCSIAVSQASNAISAAMGSDHRIVPTTIPGSFQIKSFTDQSNEAAQIIQAARNLIDEGRGRTMAILCRKDAFLNPLREAAGPAGVDIQALGKSKEQNATLQTVAAFFNYCQNPLNDEAARWFATLHSGEVEAQILDERAMMKDCNYDRQFLNLNGRNKRLRPWEILVDEYVINQEQSDYLQRWIRDACADYDSLSYAEIAGLIPTVLAVPKEDGATIYAGTIHSAKGREFDSVWVIGLEDQMIPGNRSANTWEGLQDERRCLYVAMTRARDQLVLSHCSSRDVGQWQKSGDPRSRFICVIEQFEETLPKV